MPMIKRCCFSKNLRNGTIACGVWSVVHCVMSIGVTISDIDHITRNPEDFTSNRNPDPTPLITLFWSSLIVSFLTSFSSMLLFIAVIKSYAKLLIPWLVMVVMQILCDAVTCIFQIAVTGFTKVLIAILLVWIIFTLVNIYCALCVLSHYQEVKLGRGRTIDYLGANAVRYLPEVQHVHIAEGPINYLNSQHTVYSFHSQNLYEDEVNDMSKPTIIQNGGPTALSLCNGGRVLELRPVASMPANMDLRYGGGNSYTGSIEMKVVDSIPVSLDRRNLTPYTGSLDVTSRPGKRPRRFRTVSESAVRQPLGNEKNGDACFASSLQNIVEQKKDPPGSDADKEASTSDNQSSSSGGGKSQTSTLSAAEGADCKDTAPLTNHKEHS